MSSPYVHTWQQSVKADIRKCAARGIECLLDVLKSQQMTDAVMDYLNEAKECIDSALSAAHELYDEPAERNLLGQTIDEQMDDPRRGQGTTPESLRSLGAL